MQKQLGTLVDPYRRISAESERARTTINVISSLLYIIIAVYKKYGIEADKVFLSITSPAFEIGADSLILSTFTDVSSS